MMMKLLSFLIVTAALIAGVLSASTAYAPKLDAVESWVQSAAEGDVIELANAAGRGERAEAEGGGYAPLVPAGTVIDTETIATLKGAEVEQVGINRFVFGLWSGRYIFMLSCIGLIVGGLMARFGGAAADAAAASSDAMSPEGALVEISHVVDQLRRDLPTMHDERAQLDLIMDRIGGLQRIEFASFVDGRDKIVSSMGMSGYAQVMDTFAGAERMLNRAWSAAADADLMESMYCLDVAAERLEDTVERMPSAKIPIAAAMVASVPTEPVADIPVDEPPPLPAEEPLVEDSNDDDSVPPGWD